MRALVTGANGFIGSHLVDRLLDLGHQVRAFVRPGATLEWLTGKDIDLVPGNYSRARDLEQVLEGVDLVFHVAGTVVARDWRGFFEANVIPTRRLLEAVQRHAPRIQRFVLVSSTGACGPSPDGHLVHENDPPAPVGDYGRSKLMAERSVEAFRDRLPTTIVRPCAVYGPRDRNFLIMFRHVLGGLIPVLGAGEQFISLIHVQDLADGIVRSALAPNARDNLYFLAGPRPYPRSEILATAELVAGTHARRFIIPDQVLATLLAIQTTAEKLMPRARLLSPERLATLAYPYWTFDPTKARTDFGFEPRFDLLQGLRNTYQWYVDQGWLPPRGLRRFRPFGHR